MRRTDPVFVCELCGRAFLRYPGRYDNTPVWWNSWTQSEGPCAGKVVMTYRETLLRNLEHAEQLRRTDER